ncbi:winged helix-turn-helix domain-containing protein [Paenibacillus thermoaerophilus]|uniref:Winged helix-turn-helix domain-containing protein n=1 Tax=Paenibacillus thermoaerophilus TaxID=1215385 RepID=A0ABW2UZU9_9BACL|nr:response regulator transcription factor [Paenibacillus thermoaerophilus]
MQQAVNSAELLTPTMPPLTAPQQGACCVETRRIVIVSPSPGHLHELIRDLSSSCFDVISLHRFDPELIRELEADFVLVDLTGPDPYADWHLLTQGRESAGAELKRLPHRFLVDVYADSRGWRRSLTQDRELGNTMSSREIVARIREDLETAPGSVIIDSDRRIRFKDLTIDRKKQSVYRGGVRMPLTKTEYDLLVTVLAAGGEVLSREQILNAVWGTDYYGGSNVVDVHVRSLRRKLGDRAVYSKYIATVRGSGYRMAD